MRVAFDFNPVLVNRFSGFYTYGMGLLAGLQTLEEKPEILLFHSRKFSKQVRSVAETLGNWTNPKSTSIKMRWLENIWRYSKYPQIESFVGDFDIYHSFHHLMPPTRNKPRILTVYDLRRYILPQLYSKSKLDLFESAVKYADHYIAISQSTKNDLCNIFNIPCEKVDVVYLASDFVYKPIAEAEKREMINHISKKFNIHLEKYLLVFSSPDKRKNIARTIKAFLSAKSKLSDDYQLVVVGKLPKNDEEFESIDANEISDKVLITGPLDDITNLFYCAEGLIFASLYEGFGIPILEAFACGVPVITSNCSSMSEVGSDAALYVDPYSIESIAEAMVKLCVDNNVRENLVSLGLHRSQDFSWSKTAKKTIEVYDKFV